MTITDDQLARALGAAADGIDVPEWQGVDAPAEIAVWRRRSTRWVAGTAASAAVIVGLFAMASSSPSLDRQTTPVGGLAAESGSTTGGTTGAGMDSGQPAPAGAPALGFSSQSGAGEIYGAIPMNPTPGSQLSGSAAPRGTAGQAQAPGAAAAPTGPSRVVKTGTIALVVDDGRVAATMVKLRQVAGSVGGYLSEESTQGVGSDPSGTATMRVPVARFDAVVAQISGKGFGAKVTSVTSAGKDVTAEYADTEAQIKSLKAAHNRYLTILNGADTIGEILSVQQRVDQVQGQIDRLEGSRRLIASQSDLATLQVSVNQKAAEVLITSERSGWSKAWHDATDGFTGGIQSLIAHSGKALLVLLVVIACVLLGRGGYRIARRRLI